MIISSFLLPAHWLTLIICLPQKGKAVAIAALLALLTIALNLGLFIRDANALERTEGVYQQLNTEQLAEVTACALNASLVESEIMPCLCFEPYLYSVSRNFSTLLQAMVIGISLWWLLQPLTPWLQKHKCTKSAWPCSDPGLAGTQLAAWWSLLPLLLMCVFSLTVKPVFGLKNCLFIIPGWCLLLGSWLGKQNNIVAVIWLLATLIITPPTTISAYDLENMTHERELTMIGAIDSRNKIVVMSSDGDSVLINERHCIYPENATVIALKEFKHYTSQLTDETEADIVWSVGDTQFIDQATAMLSKLGYKQTQLTCFPSLSDRQYTAMMTKKRQRIRQSIY